MIGILQNRLEELDFARQYMHSVKRTEGGVAHTVNLEHLEHLDVLRRAAIAIRDCNAHPICKRCITYHPSQLVHLPLPLLLHLCWTQLACGPHRSG